VIQGLAKPAASTSQFPATRRTRLRWVEDEKATFKGRHIILRPFVNLVDESRG
jgi:hypothetical protein